MAKRKKAKAKGLTLKAGVCRVFDGAMKICVTKGNKVTWRQVGKGKNSVPKAASRKARRASAASMTPITPAQIASCKGPIFNNASHKKGKKAKLFCSCVGMDKKGRLGVRTLKRHSCANSPNMKGKDALAAYKSGGAAAKPASYSDIQAAQSRPGGSGLQGLRRRRRRNRRR